MSTLAPEQPAAYIGNPPIRWTKYIPHSPHAKQHAGLALDWVPELLFGGAAGGAKSDWLLMGALQYVDVPGYASIIFRRTYTDLSLPGAVMDRSLQWLAPTDAKWDANDKRWTFPSGASLNFAYLKSEDDKFRYQSAEFQFVGFDELTQFTETQYLYLFSRLRRLAGSNVPLRMRSATNPGGRGHPWVKPRFRIRGHGVADNETNMKEKVPRLFLRSTLEDNPSLDKEAYEQSLAALDPYEAAQLRWGDWDARPPGDWFFEHGDIEAAIVRGTYYDDLLRAGDFAPVDAQVHGGIDWGENTHGLAGFLISEAVLAISPFNARLIEQLKWLERDPEGETQWLKAEDQHGADALVALLAPEAVKNANVTKLNRGMYIPPVEVYDYGQEPGEMARRMLASWSRFGYPIATARYDAAGVQSMRTFVSTARSNGYARLKSVKVPFGSQVKPGTSKSFKAQTAGYMRRLFMRTGEKY